MSLVYSVVNNIIIIIMCVGIRICMYIMYMLYVCILYVYMVCMVCYVYILCIYMFAMYDECKEYKNC